MMVDAGSARRTKTAVVILLLAAGVCFAIVTVRTVRAPGHHDASVERLHDEDAAAGPVRRGKGRGAPRAIRKPQAEPEALSAEEEQDMLL